MFLVAALVFAWAQTSSPALPDAAHAQEHDSIMVVGDRLRDVRLALTFNHQTRQIKCRVTRPSGDARIDTAACQMTLECTRQHRRSRERYGACMTAAIDDFLDRYLAGEQD